MITNEYIPILMLLGLGVLFVTLFTVVSIVIGPKLHGETKEMPFESGLPSKGPRKRMIF